ncbi:hypothetical protein ACFXBE_000414 [Salmonella enterica]
MVRVIIFSRLLVVNVNSDYSILVRVPSDPSRGSPTLWCMMSNVPIRITTTQMICIAIIMLLKIRNGSILVRYPDFLKNGLFFNIIRSVGDICTFESEHDHGRNEKSYAYNGVHNDIYAINRVKKMGPHSEPQQG